MNVRNKAKQNEQTRGKGTGCAHKHQEEYSLAQNINTKNIEELLGETATMNIVHVG